MQLICCCLASVLQWCPEDLMLPKPNCWMLRSGYSESPSNSNGTLVSVSVAEMCLDDSLCNGLMAMGTARRALSPVLRPFHPRRMADQGTRARHRSSFLPWEQILV